MSAAAWFQFTGLIAVLMVTAMPLGRYMARVYGDESKAPGDRFFLPIERLIYRLCRVDPAREQTLDGLRLFAFGLQHHLFSRRIRVCNDSRGPCL